MMSLTTCGRQLSKFKNGRNRHIRRLRCCISREQFEPESPNVTGASMPSCPTFAPASPTTSGRKLQRKTVEIAASDGLVCIKSNERRSRIQISRVKNIGNVFELSGLALRLAQPYGGPLVELHLRTASDPLSTNPYHVVHTW